MTWNLLHLARMLKDAGGIPAYGNLPEEWKAGSGYGFENPYGVDNPFGFENPEYR